MGAGVANSIVEQVWIAEAIMKAAAPADDMAGAPMLKVLELALEDHLRALWETHELADSVRGRLLPDIIAKARGGPRLPQTVRNEPTYSPAEAGPSFCRTRCSPHYDTLRMWAN